MTVAALIPCVTTCRERVVEVQDTGVRSPRVASYVHGSIDGVPCQGRRLRAARHHRDASGHAALRVCTLCGRHVRCATWVEALVIVPGEGQRWIDVSRLDPAAIRCWQEVA